MNDPSERLPIASATLTERLKANARRLFLTYFGRAMFWPLSRRL